MGLRSGSCSPYPVQALTYPPVSTLIWTRSYKYKSLKGQVLNCDSEIAVPVSLKAPRKHVQAKRRKEKQVPYSGWPVQNSGI
jgi:hypothetical protein